MRRCERLCANFLFEKFDARLRECLSCEKTRLANFRHADSSRNNFISFRKKSNKRNCAREISRFGANFERRIF